MGGMHRQAIYLSQPKFFQFVHWPSEVIPKLSLTFYYALGRANLEQQEEVHLVQEPWRSV